MQVLFVLNCIVRYPKRTPVMLLGGIGLIYGFFFIVAKKNFFPWEIRKEVQKCSIFWQQAKNEEEQENTAHSHL